MVAFLWQEYSMKNHNDGKEYEEFVRKIQQAILDSEKCTSQKNIQIEKNKIILDNCGVKREFDLYWEYELGGLTYKTVVECKDYNSNISVEKIDALVGKTKDIPDLRAVFATKTGYQSGAKTKAKYNKIDLLLVREQDDTDWNDEYGNPLVRKLHIEMKLISSARITKFSPVMDGKWAKANTDIDIENPIELSGRNDAIYIEDLENNEKYSLYDLQDRLAKINKHKYGEFSKEVKFDNAFICSGKTRIKMLSYKVDYTINQPMSETIKIDFSAELVGVIEYLQKGTTKTVFEKGMVKDGKRKIQR
jgi:Restriction endonuclease